MSDSQTEARAIVSGFIKRLTYVSRTDQGTIVKAIETALAAKEAELAGQVGICFRTEQRRADAVSRAERAEAQLAEANKALEEIADAKTELTNRHDYSRGWNDALFRVRQIARRAREAQGGK